jgi:hypothetical protein
MLVPTSVPPPVCPNLPLRVPPKCAQTLNGIHDVIAEEGNSCVGTPLASCIPGATKFSE